MTALWAALRPSLDARSHGCYSMLANIQDMAWFEDGNLGCDCWPMEITEFAMARLEGRRGLEW
jgi:hypothetical protein